MSPEKTTLVLDVRAALTAAQSSLRQLSSAPLVASDRSDDTATLSPLPSVLFIWSKPGFGVETHQVPALMELLTLFTILSRLDRQAWRDQVVDTWETLDSVADAALAAGKPFVFGLEASVVELPLLRSTFAGRVMSATFNDFCSRAAALVDAELVSMPEPVPVRIVLPFALGEDDIDQRLETGLRRVVEVVDAMRSHASHHGAKDQVFSIEEVYIDHGYRVVVSIGILDCLRQLASRDVRIANLPGFQGSDRGRMLEDLRVLVPSDGSSSNSPGVSTVVVSDRASSEAMQAVLSALVYSRSVYRVVVDCHTQSNGPTSEEFWRWVGYAVYSRESNVFENTWQLPFAHRALAEEIAIVRSVVEAADPLGVLMCEERDPEIDDVVVSARRFFFSAPQRESESSESPDYVSRDLVAVRAVKKTRDGYSVLLPGYGKAWVRGEDVENVVKRPTSSLRRGSSLTISCSSLHEDDMDMAMAHFHLVGDRVRTLNIKSAYHRSSTHDDQPDAWLQDILRACPRLEELTLGSLEIASLRVFVNSSNLRKLVFRDCVGTAEDEGEWPFFFETLSNPRHPLSRNLEELHLWFNVNDAHAETFMTMVDKLLDSNKRLRDIFFTVYTEGELQPRYRSWAYSKNSQYEVPVAKRSKLAFVGAISSILGDSTLDSSLLSTIFDFAAHSEQRVFRLRVY